MKYFLYISTVLLVFACNKSEQMDLSIDTYCDTKHSFVKGKLSSQLFPFQSKLDSLTGLLVLEQGDAAMIARAWLTENATKTIDIQYFIFSMDNVGKIALDYLLGAADRGIKVRILVDDIMVDADESHLSLFNQHPNIEIKIYNPQLNIGKSWDDKIGGLLTDFKGINQRMHNKTLILDGEVAITGGRNIADEYFDYDHEYNFRDRDILLIGKEVKAMNLSFDAFWNSELSVKVGDLITYDSTGIDTSILYNYIRNYACNPENFWPQIRERISNVPTVFDSLVKSEGVIWTKDIYFVSDVPGKNKTEGMKGGGVTTDTLVQLLLNAKEEVYIQSPYLVVDNSALQLLDTLRNKGIEFHVLTNSLSSTDNLDAFNGYQRNRDSLVEMGINIYEYRPDASIRKKLLTGDLQKELEFVPVFGLHAKSMVIDQEIVVIGTFNFDPRSANLNTECIVVIKDKLMAKQVLLLMQEELKPENAWQVTSEYNPDVNASKMKRLNTWWRRVVPASIL